MNPVTHIVSFKFNAKASADDQAGLYRALLNLKDACKKDGKPYILSAKGGRQISKEPFHHDMQIGFILEFASSEDLDYYCDHDEAHQAFIKEWAVPERGICDGVVVLDFEEGWKGA
ncbi:hypothetical protein NliqN6_0464 [Naganishia liquefaciens]|uniref:Stress-response A/B barrel domain-containing protein n=1 Tax=Naganishia liquefaciens TaxID=104408 RepID=A0A8H3TMX9_9TREE|nr:hypothetical protein NliqN6_0464 [Naganishia liquefaciens]